MNERLIKDFEAAADDLYRQITGRLSSASFMVYGHSLGAILALRVTLLLEKDKKPPLQLIVTGNPGPGIRDRRKRYQLGREELKTELKNIGGVPPAFFVDEELFDFFEPILRADFELAEEHPVEQLCTTQTPICAMMGSREEFASCIGNWKQYTASRFDHQLLEGDHFFIYDHPQKITQIIRECHREILLF